jgi:ActR/RegA family two-component response regulator
MNDEELQAIRNLRAAIESQERVMLEGFASQARSIESLRESASYNTETIATALELAAISQRTAAAAQETAAATQATAASTAAANMELSANILRAIDKSEQNIARLEQMMGIVIGEGRADRGRITRLEGQN